MSPAPVVLVAGDFVPHGGMDRANYALASYLARTGRPVRLVAHRVAPALAARPGVSVDAARRPFGSHFLGAGCLRRAGLRAARETAAAGGRAVVNGGNCPFPDANWAHYVHASYRPAVVGSALRRVKAAVERPLVLKAEREAYRVARVVVANSERTRRGLMGLGVPAGRVKVVYLTADPELFRPAAAGEREELRAALGWPIDRAAVLFVGGLGDRRKGFDTAFAAWIDLCREPDWDAVLVAVGEGAERAAWEARAAAAGLADRFRFLGFRPDVPDLLRAADALVAPTRYEPYGLGAHEALCCGLPAFVTAAAGVAERYPAGLADLLLPDPDDAADLAARLRRWRAAPSLWAAGVRSLSDALRARTWDDVARDFLAAAGIEPGPHAPPPPEPRTAP